MSDAEFTRDMKLTHKIYLPDMLHYHNELLQAAFGSCGYQLEILPEKEQMSNVSLPFISGDYCLPAMLILGQVLSFVQSDSCDITKIAIMEPQTGGACRAGNYYNSIKMSLKKAGYPYIPVISLNISGDEKHSGFTITPKLIRGAIAAICYGDILMTLMQQVRPYEQKRGSTEACYNKWVKLLCKEIIAGKSISRNARKCYYKKIVNDFKQIKVLNSKKKKVGIAGEVYIKFSPIGNEHLEDFLLKNDCEYRMGGFVNYAIFVVHSELKKQRLMGQNRIIENSYMALIKYLEKLQNDIIVSIKESKIFKADADFNTLKENVDKIISDNCNIGDGWLIAGEAIDLINQGYQNILLVHPFGCLVSHVCVRGVLKKLNEKYPNVNIHSIEYDYNSSKTLRESRIMLGISR